MILTTFWPTKRPSEPQESCVKVVREALSLGAWGVGPRTKTRAEEDIVVAVDAVLAGSRFVSRRLVELRMPKGYGRWRHASQSLSV